MKIELFFKTSIQLSAVLELILQRPKLQSHLQFNIPNKVRDENLLPFANKIHQIIPTAEVCLHYSLKNQRHKGLDDASLKFETYLTSAHCQGVSEVLLVSGSGDKRSVNSLTCLQTLQRHNFQLPPNMKVSVAFNPYFLSIDEYGIEKQRLLEKIETGYVSIIYLQFGSNPEMLQQSLEWIDTLRKSGRIGESTKIYGSIFLPSKQLLARMRFRPWKGVLLTDEFLSEVDNAEAIVRVMLDLYRRYQVEIIVETAFRTVKEAEAMERLLGV